MNRRVLVRRVSDLLSKWLGDTERNLAAAFDEAHRDGAILLFDEADTFLRDRRHARAAWELSQTNELLQQLETFPGVVACTTNLRQDLDPACLRRFTHKVELRYLTHAQSLTLFRAILEDFLPEPPDADEDAAIHRTLASLTTLTPGDFATIARRLALVWDRTRPPEATVAQLLTELEAEVAAKQPPPRAIGF